MREILFKAKILNSDEWIEGYYVKGATRHCILKNLTGYPKWDIDPNTLCQYTGLIDNNGDKIWENDIVRLDEDLYIVTWEEDDAMFALEDVGIVEHFSNVDSKWCEIIGNKFDNPDLI